MAIKGLTNPVFGNYAYNGNVVSYSAGFVCGAAVEYSAEIETSEDNPLYADDKIQENDYGTFTTGTLTLNTSDLDQQTSIFLLGLKTNKIEIGDTTVTELVYDDDQQAPTLGFGIIETHQINNVNQYRAVLLCKVVPKIPSDSATTKGESIEWQTKEIELAIERSDQDSEGYHHPWKREAWFDTHEDALNYLKYILNVMETVQLSSAAGSSAGQTVITVENPTAAGTYVYSTSGPVPTYQQNLASWAELTSGEAIEATNGSTLYVALVDSNKNAIGYGTVTVVANEGP